MEVFDNVTKIVKGDLEVVIEKNSRLSIAAACFSIYAYFVCFIHCFLRNIKRLCFVHQVPPVNG